MVMNEEIVGAAMLLLATSLLTGAFRRKRVRCRDAIRRAGPVLQGKGLRRLGAVSLVVLMLSTVAPAHAAPTDDGHKLLQDCETASRVIERHQTTLDVSAREVQQVAFCLGFVQGVT